MRIVIIEDEKLTSEDLAETIQQINPAIQIMAILNSVRTAELWFAENEEPDLIFSDIQLGDGLCFDIFRNLNLNVPVIFCTAYDEYALKAFKANGIDYILKPFDKTSIENALKKYDKIKSALSVKLSELKKVVQLFDQKRRQASGSILVYQKDKILPIRFDEIALFYIENEITHLLTFTQRNFIVNKTMEETEAMASGDFYRVNRQYLINRKAIQEASQYFGRKLSLTLTIPFKETITISKVKVSDFLSWLAGQ